jgi:hypothetical protein
MSQYNIYASIKVITSLGVKIIKLVTRYDRLPIRDFCILHDT